MLCSLRGCHTVLEGQSPIWSDRIGERAAYRYLCIRCGAEIGLDELKDTEIIARK